MYRGYVKQWRKLKEWEWYKTPHMVHLFGHLLREANHKEGRWQGVAIQRGQLITGRKQLASATGISERSVRTCLERLKSTNEIAIKSTSKFSVITIVGYDKYQSDEERPTSTSTITLASDRPATDQRPTTNKNDNNDNNEKKDSVVLNAPPPAQLARAFFDDENNRTELSDILVSRGFTAALVSLEVKKFVAYWTERNGSGKKQRWEMEKTFELSRRLSRWFSNLKH